MASSETRTPRFYNYPYPRLTDSGPPRRRKYNNPTVRGYILRICAWFVDIFPIIPRILYMNTGFSSLKNIKRLHESEYRLDPTVIPIQDLFYGKFSINSYAGFQTQAKDVPSSLSTASTGYDHNRYYNIMDYHQAYLSSRFTPSDVAEALLPIIRRDVDSPSNHSVAFLQVREDLVRKAALESTNRFRNGSPIGVLDGVPIAIKDEADLFGYKKHFGTKMDFTNPQDETSWFVKMLLEEGVIIMGKTVMQELGLDTTNNNPNHGTPRNPHNELYYTGGSSGGTAYAVSSGIVPIGFGSDGGGSIRIPASFCGLFGLKTSHGRVSGRPCLRISISNGVQGTMASSMVDLELSYRVISRPDPERPSSAAFGASEMLEAPNGEFKTSKKERSKVFGIYQDWIDLADPEVKEACQRAINYFVDKLGYRRVDINLPYVTEGGIAHALTILSEITSSITPEQESQLTPSNRILAKVGSCTTAHDLFAAQRIRNILMEHLAALFDAHPDMIIITPTSPMAGWPIIRPNTDLKFGISDTNRSIHNMQYVWMANFSGLPSMTVPIGYAKPSKGKGEIPIGMMGAARWGDENTLLAWGYEAERYIKETSQVGQLRLPQGWVDVFGRTNAAGTSVPSVQPSGSLETNNPPVKQNQC